jgi:glucosyl-3-phosphoglycerate phosphatase
MNRFFIARHGQTVFNAAARMQGDILHTPFTRIGFAQAEAIGEALRVRLGARPAVTMWASPTGRALQTLAVVAEHLDLDWHRARTDPRLAEIDIGGWSGLQYDEVKTKHGPALDRASGLFSCRPPGGEWYDDVAARLRSWLNETGAEEGDRIVVTHGMTSRVLRGLLTGAEIWPESGTPIACSVPQGSVVELVDGVETLLGRQVSSPGA